jgi:pimeloyl-ACP methyl ester carboxylesterase
VAGALHLPGAALLALLLAGAVGCGANNGEYLTDRRMDNGMIIILPGIEGVSRLNRNIRDGLNEADIRYAMPIHSWGRPVPLFGALMNQMDFVGNRLAAKAVAKRVIAYQDCYPGNPVYIVGHSGGGGIAVFAAEALPEDRQIDGLILLSASISGNYDMTKALKRCRKGIVNFHDVSDTALLGVGTTVLGNVDGGHGPAAGRLGFAEPTSRDSDETKLAYSRLYQVPIQSDDSPHMAVTRSTYVSADVAPWIMLDRWPVGSTARLGYDGPTFALKADHPRQPKAPGREYAPPKTGEPGSGSEVKPSRLIAAAPNPPAVDPPPKAHRPTRPPKDPRPTPVWIGFEDDPPKSPPTTRPATAPASKPAQTQPAAAAPRKTTKPAKPEDGLPARPWTPWLPVEGT